MSRTLRFDVADSVHHVTNRGLERRAIVRDDADRRAFIRLLGRIAVRHQWRVFTWVLMDNHFHLFFRIPTPALSMGMHDLESGYVSVFNRRHDRSGPLFQGRFHNVVVEDESHGWELTRYLHLNPCRARLAPRPEAWPWSSYRHFLDPRDAPGWLDWPTVLAERGRNESAARIAYKRFVEAGLRDGIPSPLSAAVDGWILGSGAFAERVRSVCLAGLPAGPRATDDIIAVAAKTLGASPTVIRCRRRHGNDARQVAILLCRELLALPASQLASAFDVSPSGLSMTVQRAAARVDNDPDFAQQVHRVREELAR